MRSMFFILFASSIPLAYPLLGKRTIHEAFELELLDTSLAQFIKTAEEVLENTQLQEAEKFKQITSLSINCSHCSFSADMIALAKHLRTVHCLASKDKLYLCPLCPIKCASTSQINRHIKIGHLKIKDFCCPQCMKTFSRQYGVESHIAAVHDKIRGQKCPYCSHSTTERQNLLKHIERRHKHEHPCVG